MEVKNQILMAKINSFCQEIEQEFDLIPNERKAQLNNLSNYIFKKFQQKECPKLIVICTHNSRRSHLGQIWLAVGADYYQLPNIQTFSGGTEATAFNFRAVKALERIGFSISIQEKNNDNPIYAINWKKEMKPYQAFSKKYDHPTNSKDQFAAIMVCTQADEGCPVIFGNDFRISLPYDDPKNFDGTALESIKYEERTRQIGRQMLYLLSQVKKG